MIHKNECVGCNFNLPIIEKFQVPVYDSDKSLFPKSYVLLTRQHLEFNKIDVNKPFKLIIKNKDKNESNY